MLNTLHQVDNEDCAAGATTGAGDVVSGCSGLAGLGSGAGEAQEFSSGVASDKNSPAYEDKSKEAFASLPSSRLAMSFFNC